MKTVAQLRKLAFSDFEEYRNYILLYGTVIKDLKWELGNSSRREYLIMYKGYYFSLQMENGSVTGTGYSENKPAWVLTDALTTN